MRASRFALVLTFTLAAWGARPAAARDVVLLNASYDVTRELFKDINPAFAASWKTRTGDAVVVNQSHGGSSKQARAVIDGLQADVVTMNQALDIDMISELGRQIPRDWAAKLPNGSAPFQSTIVFLVRGGNPKHIRDWDDLVRPGVRPVIPNPKTSGNGRYSYLAAWAYAAKKKAGGDEAAQTFVTKLFRAVPVLDTGGRGATTTFAQRGIGDVLLTFENEAALAAAEARAQGKELTIVVPTFSVRAEIPVAVVEKVARKHGTEAVAKAYLEFLFTPAGQEIGARHWLRPTSEDVLARHADRFAKVELVSVESLGGWKALQSRHFADGGLFDRIFSGDR